MSELIHLRQRMKAIETIKKITHAMRLIAMSSHAQLKHQEIPLRSYVDSTLDLFTKAQAGNATWRHPLLNPNQNDTEHAKHLVILVGSQKGLCGNFNTTVLHHYDATMATIAQDGIDLIAVGKKAVDHTKRDQRVTVISSYEKFSIQNLFIITQEIIDHIIHSGIIYKTISVISNIPISFFYQKPTTTLLVPTNTMSFSDAQAPHEGYYWEQEPAEVLNNLVVIYLEAGIEQLLFQSLLAEHAARFVSMDSSTRNAKNLLDATKLQYNKMRQAKITKELTELAGSL